MDASEDITAVNTYGALGLLGRHVASGYGHGFFAYDPSGNIVEQVGPTGNLLNTDLYDAYGDLLWGNASQTDPFGFGGQWGYFTDSTTGVILAEHRYYDPAAGRWINRDPIGYDGGLNLYGYVGDDPENEGDPAGFLGFSDPNGDHNFWINAAAAGMNQGGVLGNAQAAGSIAMAGAIDFFGARNVQNHASAAGNAAGHGNAGGEAFCLGATAVDIALAALPGITGGGGDAAKGVRLADVGWYELGSQTIKGKVYEPLSGMSKVDLGKYLWKTYGWESVFKSGPLAPTRADWLKTIPQGPTPGLYAATTAWRTAMQQWLGACGCN